MPSPFGRGITLQIATDDLESTHEDLRKLDCPLFDGPSEIWYRTGETEEAGSREFLVQDPDGYLIRFVQSIGTRSVR